MSSNPRRRGASPKPGKASKTSPAVPPRLKNRFEEDIGNDDTDSAGPSSLNDGTPKADPDAGLTPEQLRKKKVRAVQTRVFWSTVMVSIFALLIALGHFYVALLVTGLTCSMFREIIGLKRKLEMDNKIPLFRTLRW